MGFGFAIGMFLFEIGLVGSIGAGLAIASITTSLVVGIALSLTASLLLPKPQVPDFGVGTSSLASGRTENTNIPISTWKIVYGELRKGGDITYQESTDNNNVFHRIITFSSHPSTSVISFYLNDEVIYPEELDGDGLVTVGTYANKVQIQVDLGATDQPFPDLVTESDGLWTDVHRQSNHTKAWIRFDFDRDVFANGLPKLTIRARWKKYTDTRTSTEVFGTNPAQIVNDYLLTSNNKGGLGVVSSRIDTTVLNNSSNISEGKQAVAAGQSHEVISVSTTNDTLDLVGDLSKLVTEDVVQLTSTDTLPAGLSFATDYFVDLKHEAKSGSSNIQIRLATSIANIYAGTFVDITGTGSGTHTVNKVKEPLYTSNGVINTGDTPSQILSDMKSAMGGRILYVGGQWLIKAGAFETPTIEFDESDMTGPINVQTKITRSERFNAIKGIFVSMLSFDQPDEYPLVSDSTFQANDGGTQLIRDLDLPFTNRSATGQRLATLELQRARREITVEMPLNMRGFLVIGGDTITVSNDILGFVSQPFEITDWVFEIGGDSEAPVYGIRLSLRQTDSAVFTYSTTGEVTKPPSSISTLPDVGAVVTPTNVALASGTSQLLAKDDGTVVSRLRISWTDSVDGFVTFHRAEYKKSEDSDWIALAQVPVGQSESFVWEVEDGVSYDGRVIGINYFGTESLPVEELNHIIIGQTALPADITSFNIDGTRLSWDELSNTPDLAGYAIRFQYGDNPSFGDATPLHTDEITASPYDMIVTPDGAVTIMIKAVDRSENFSALPAVIKTNLGDPITANVVETFPQAPDWTGTLTDGTIVSGDIKADGSGQLMWNADDTANRWTVDSNVYFKGTFLNMIYETEPIFVVEALLGSKMTIDQNIVGNSIQIEYRLNSPDARWSEDTEPNWTTDATLMWGAPGSYLPWPGSIIVENDLYDFRLQTGFGATQGVVDTFTPTVDAPDVTESLSDVVLAAGGTRLTLVETYESIKVVNLTLQDDGGSAVTAKVIDKSIPLGPLVQGFDSSEVGTSASVDVIVQGF